jgi:hypothetical protein
MRFITEFELRPPETTDKMEAYKGRGEFEIGQLIAQSFGWKQVGQMATTGPAILKSSLEIEAFPIDKWIEFKKRFKDALPDYDSVSRTRLLNALDDLESFVMTGNEKPR